METMSVGESGLTRVMCNSVTRPCQHLDPPTVGPSRHWVQGVVGRDTPTVQLRELVRRSGLLRKVDLVYVVRRSLSLRRLVK